MISRLRIFRGLGVSLVSSLVIATPATASGFIDGLFGDPKHPVENPTPKHVVKLVVSGPDDAAYARATAIYNSDFRKCATHNILVGDLPLVIQTSIPLEKVGENYVGSIVVDHFQPDRCDWKFVRAHLEVDNTDIVGSAIHDPLHETGSELAQAGDFNAAPGAPNLQRDLWCYRVTYKSAPMHNCEDLSTLKWSNAVRAINRAYLAQYSAIQIGEEYTPRITDQTKELRVVLHNLNAVAGALMPVGGVDAQVARAKEDRN